MTNSNPNGNPPGSWAQTGQIYKAELDGTVIGKFGKAGKLEPNFQVVHMMDCRNPDVIYVGEIEKLAGAEIRVCVPRPLRRLPPAR